MKSLIMQALRIPQRTPVAGFFTYSEYLSISSPVRIPRPEHSISRARLSRAAVQTLYGLKDAGYEALLVGGSVRDLLLGLNPKDYDVTTDADPEQVQAVFRRCRLIGRRFRLAHVRFGPEIIEVATFRSAPRTPDEEVPDEDAELDDEFDEALEEVDAAPLSNGLDNDHLLHESGRILRDNVYGSMEEDAFRRDFTVNALYYDIRDFAVVDYVGGVADLEAKRLRLIGDPETRYREDPVRMLRAVRFASKLDFVIDPSAAEPIAQLKHLIVDVPPARLFDESLKLFLNAHAEANFDGLRHFGLFDVMFPTVAQALESPRGELAEQIIRLALRSTQNRIKADKPVTPGFLFAAFLWVPVMDLAQRLREEGATPVDALTRAAQDMIAGQVEHVAIPRRFSSMQADIWHMQPRLEFRRGKRPFRMLEHKRFRAAYDFLLLRAQAGDADQDLADWWTRFQEVGQEERQAMADSAPASPGGAPSGRRRRRKRR